MGLPAFRFDFHGVADSTGSIDKFRLDQPFVTDLEDAVQQVREMTFAERYVFAGVCFGGRTGLAYAADKDGVAGIAMVSMPVHSAARVGPSRSPYETLSFSAMVRLGLQPWVMKDVLRADRRRAYRKILGSWWRLHRASNGVTLSGPPNVGADVVDQVGRALERGAHLLFVYGSQDQSHAEFVTACEGRLGKILSDAGPRCAVKVIPGDVHGFGHVDTQDAVIATISEWVSGLAQSALAPRSNEATARASTA